MKIYDLPGSAIDQKASHRDFRHPEQVLQFESLYEMARFVDPDVASGRGAWPAEFDPHRVNIKDAPYLASEDTIHRPSSNGEMAFNATRSLRATLELAYHGWQAGRERLGTWNAALEREFRKRIARNTFVHDLAGIEVNVPAMLAGEPEHMLDYQQAQTNARSIDLIVDMNVRCDACGVRHHDAAPTPPEWVLARGAALTMLVRALLLANYQPTIKARTTSLYRGYHYTPTDTMLNRIWPCCYAKPFLRTIEVTVHRPSDILDIDRINFVLSHESFARRMEFRVHEILNLHAMNGLMQTTSARRMTQEFVGNLPLVQGHKQHLQSQLGRGDLYIPSSAVLMDALIDDAIDTRDGTYRPPESFRKGARGGDDPDDNNDLGPFKDPTMALTWVFDVLDEFGVQFA